MTYIPLQVHCTEGIRLTTVPVLKVETQACSYAIFDSFKYVHLYSFSKPLLPLVIHYMFPL